MSRFGNKCPIEDIAAYIDGELNALREAEIEAHFTVCDECNLELNLQKQFLCNVSSGLKQDGHIELPSNFAKKIAVNAESSVSGLRQPGERFNAVFICAALALFALFALGSDATRLLNLIYGAFDQIVAVGAFLGQLVYSFFVGVAIVLRTFAGRAGLESLAAIAFAVFCFAMTVRYRRSVLRLLGV